MPDKPTENSKKLIGSTDAIIGSVSAGREVWKVATEHRLPTEDELLEALPEQIALEVQSALMSAAGEMAAVCCNAIDTYSGHTDFSPDHTTYARLHATLSISYAILHLSAVIKSMRSNEDLDTEYREKLIGRALEELRK